jgi:AbrB family looped-hinge helix DNA binding protein
MPKATLTSKGQLTLPKDIRSRLGVAAGDQVEFTIGNDGSITVVAARRSASELFGMLAVEATEPVSIEDMNRAIADRAASDDERIRGTEP